MKALDSRGRYDLPCSIKWTSGDGVTNYSHFNDVTNSFYCVIVFLKEERNYQFINLFMCCMPPIWRSREWGHWAYQLFGPKFQSVRVHAHLSWTTSRPVQVRLRPVHERVKLLPTALPGCVCPILKKFDLVCFHLDHHSVKSQVLGRMTQRSEMYWVNS